MHCRSWRVGRYTVTLSVARLLADNQIALNAGWDEALLQQELQALRGLEFDLSVELSPAYCDVIVRRWQAFTGQQAIHAEHGGPFPA